METFVVWVVCSKMSSEQGGIDITQLLRDTANLIEDGYFTTHPNFSIEGSMRSVDITDPKVDTGLGGHGLMTIKERIQKGYSVFDH